MRAEIVDERGRVVTQGALPVTSALAAERGSIEQGRQSSFRGIAGVATAGTCICTMSSGKRSAGERQRLRPVLSSHSVMPRDHRSCFVPTCRRGQWSVLDIPAGHF